MLPTAVLQVPQWQGSSVEDARLLSLGAERLASLLTSSEPPTEPPTGPSVRVVRVPVPDTAGTERDGVRALDVLNTVAARTRAALGECGTATVVTVGGDCGVQVEPVSAALERHGDGLTVVWFDAHGDLNTPGSSPSHAFHGMVLRTLLGEGHPDLVPPRALHPRQVILAGVRALDPAELAYAADAGLARHTVAELTADPGVLVPAVAAGGTAVYIHIDLDVLDPEEFGSLSCPEAGGLSVAALRDAVRALTARFPLAGLGITEYAPRREEDQAVLASLVPALLADAATG
ncbi:arginase family protein [Microbispora sp. H13382]|uniref:arginase family protein n=1 Tax=Microbispora sp. H13382 TaxID=2729112 RepID=UPI0016049EC8|nr:arginase family protein [Microbispora sp. H13382]